MKTVVLISPHHISSKRKAGFHWLADAFSKKDYQTVFLTAPIRYTALLTNDHRTQYFSIREIKEMKKIPHTNISSYIFMTLLNPLSSNNKIFQYISIPLAKWYGKLLPRNLKEAIIAADIIIFESSEALLLFNSFKKINKNAKYIYRVSDDLKLNHSPHYIINFEEQIAPKFDLISVPSEFIYKKFSQLPNCRLHCHGINKELFSKQYNAPKEYSQFEKNIVFVGTSRFDYNFIKIATKLFPKWGFHIIGPIAEEGASMNLLYYGEKPFINIIPYIQHADVGLQNLTCDYGLASFSDSLKVLQYTFCKLPIVAPIGLQSSRENIISYLPDNHDSIRDALICAMEYDRKSIDVSKIKSWDELTELLVKEVNIN